MGKVEQFKTDNKGFTLIELLIAMAIFITFTGIIINSYTSIVRSQRDANDYRTIYSEARTIFEEIVDTSRDMAVYYGDNLSSEFTGAVSELTFVSKDGQKVVRYALDEGRLRMDESLNCGLKRGAEYLNSEKIEVFELSFYVSPAFNPYLSDNVMFNSLQFQPKVTVFARFKRGDNEIDLQTSVSSRIYSVLPEIDFSCLPKNEKEIQQ
ncbi:prepilin-type N-terminal cleavage/methylation domain-containing protein [Candidatus Peregrinibacteria bacterium]|nr:prepilin-type N-terminal cleavage/methylation domain-containing protein [Candidatus Peregrinibacteria bacterium]